MSFKLVRLHPHVFGRGEICLKGLKRKTLLNFYKLHLKTKQKPTPSGRYKAANFIQAQRKHNALRTMFSHQKVLETEKKSIFRTREQKKGHSAQLTKPSAAGQGAPVTPAHAAGADVRRDATSPATGSGTEAKRDKPRINSSRECQLASPEIQGVLLTPHVLVPQLEKHHPSPANGREAAGITLPPQSSPSCGHQLRHRGGHGAGRGCSPGPPQDTASTHATGRCCPAAGLGGCKVPRSEVSASPAREQERRQQASPRRGRAAGRHRPAGGWHK